MFINKKKSLDDVAVLEVVIRNLLLRMVRGSVRYHSFRTNSQILVAGITLVNPIESLSPQRAGGGGQCGLRSHVKVAAWSYSNSHHHP